MDTTARTTGSRPRPTPARRALVERFSGWPAWVVLTQLFIGLGWLRAASEKLIDPAWWSGAVIDDFVTAHGDMTVGWYEPLLASAILPLAPLVAVIVFAGQLVAGISLVTGRRLAVGLAAGMMMNLNFMAAGAVTPSMFYLLAQGTLASWLCERSADKTTASGLRSVAAIATLVAGLNVAFISTLHPAHVIEDPAVMFSFAGALTALTCLLSAGSASGSACRDLKRSFAAPPRGRPGTTAPGVARDVTSRRSARPNR